MEKRSFKGPLSDRRCVVLADGYYEWQQQAGYKQPYWIRRASDGLLLLAGLWERNSRVADLPVESCTIITTQANSAMSRIHDRMPMVLTEETALQWLEPDVGAVEAASLLKEIDDDFLAPQPVSSYVNNARNEGPECIAAATAKN